MRRHFLLSLALVGFLLASCSFYRIESADTTYDYYPSKKTVDEVIYLEEVDKPFKEIGKVYVTTERRQSLNDVVRKMKYEAAILGGDAITDVETNAAGVWKKIGKVKQLDNAYIHAKFSAKVIVFK